MRTTAPRRVPPGAPPHPAMVWVPGARSPWARRPLPRRPRPTGSTSTGSGSTARPSPTDHGVRARPPATSPWPSPLTRRTPRPASAGGGVQRVPPAPRPGRPVRRVPWWTWVPGADWRHLPVAAAGPGRPPGRHAPRRCRRLRGVGRQGPADQAGERAARGASTAPSTPGATSSRRAAALGQRMAGRVPARTWCSTAKHGPAPRSPQRLRAVPGDRQRGVDLGLVPGPRPARVTTRAPSPTPGAAPGRPASTAPTPRPSPVGGGRVDRICALQLPVVATGPPPAWPRPVDTSTSHLGFRCIVRP